MAVTTWTDADLEQLKTLWESGLSAAKIGETMNRSRNAVLGAAHRSGLPDHKNWRSGRPRSESEPKSPKRRPDWSAPHRGKRRDSQPPKPVPQVQRAPLLEPVEPVSFMDLAPHHCRAVISSSSLYGALASYCGLPKVQGYSYCEFHCDLFILPARSR